MALPVAATVAFVLGGAAYLDAKYQVRHDYATGSLVGNARRARNFVEQRAAENKLLISQILQSRAENPKEADEVFLLFEDRSFTWRTFWGATKRIANWLIEDSATGGVGVQKGDIVAMDGGNSPEYVMLWFAIEAVGASPAFINCNLTGTPLTHCVKLCDSKVLIADVAIRGLVDPVRQGLEGDGVRVLWYHTDFFDELKVDKPLPKDRQCGHKPGGIAGLIYTSGTTGLPKATVMTKGREINTARTIALYLRLKPGVRMYTALPLYHGSAHSLCVIPAIYAGSTVVLGRKFSHKTFWPEVRSSGAHIIQYVGEMCRYLVNAPPHPDDRNHNVRRALGNGMRPDVWEAFRQRFGVETINEFYGATEGVGTCFNENRGPFGRNAVTRRGLLWHLMNGHREVRVQINIETEEVVRGPDGFAVRSKIGEAGELLSKLDPAAPNTTFAGYYKNKPAGDKRMISDVFQKGDLWFRSGDLTREDADGCVYFVDRLGDTFRWKSENVSTNEVAECLVHFEQVAEVNVYGVEVPNADGRAGCAAIVLAEGLSEDTFDFGGFARHALETLPRYAVPIFIRVVKEIQYTGTMKMEKAKMRKEGIDPDKIHAAAQAGGTPDSVYWLPPGKQAYVPFTVADWVSVKKGGVKL
ncbi:uncharacterized protein Z520_05281 [Fonsecaea multimorphosa CBS 102226]|uniref:Uncharacterized protein n=1 Tax=Fonsecaea multimorphosa CBS 102226 TaxID=1442371 RepID=A0A0D2HAC0_9EURO|nr:uncharacterized protein Z520_05281 [Fonsecaea multimorphosa CBS 102226]KIX98820.1 hypothetical protein Z520_05281 [Fonsecaea multimorphosa CBS 102226]